MILIKQKKVLSSILKVRWDEDDLSIGNLPVPSCRDLLHVLVAEDGIGWNVFDVSETALRRLANVAQVRVTKSDLLDWIVSIKFYFVQILKLRGASNIQLL